jgi:hypothetical protein
LSSRCSRGLGTGVGALAGFLAGLVKGIDSEFTVAGRPEAVVADYWRKLAAQAREGRLPGQTIRRPGPFFGFRLGFRI